MTIWIFDSQARPGDDRRFEQWKRDNPNGFILNTHRDAEYDYAKIHRVGCPSSEYAAGSTSETPFTGEVQIKVCSDESRQELVDWLAQNRARATGNLFCQRCNP